MGQPAARISDMHTCPMFNGPVPHVGGPIAAGAPVVLIGGLPAARVGDMATCVGPPDTIIKGSTSVLICGMPAARIGDSTAHGGVIVAGCPTVLIGDGAGGASVITQALKDQKNMLESKKAELERWNESDQAKFKKAFGSTDDNAKKIISDRIDRMLKLNKSMSEKNFTLVPVEESKANRFARVDKNDSSHTVQLDTQFWKANTTPPDTKAGVLTHEMSHFKDIGDTNDKFDVAPDIYNGGDQIYGQADSHQLAIDRPDLALKHADSFEYWAEDQ
jgi:uncharacterized Zn-binding protein involved in type VI secretion